MGIGDAGNYRRIEVALLPRRHFGRHMSLMHRLVGQHGLADDVADGEDVRHAGAHLAVDRDEAAIIDHHAGLLGADLLAVRAASGGLQDHVVALCLGRCLLAVELDPEAVRFGVHGDGFGLQHHLVETLGVLLFPDLDQVAVRALHQAVEHFDHVNFGAQRRVHRRHFQADDAAADDQHALGHETQLEGAGGIDDARILRDEGQMKGCGPRGDDAFLEADDLPLAGLFLCAAGHGLDFEMVGIEEVAIATHGVDLARLGHAGEATGELADYFFLVRTKLVDIHLGRRKTDTEIAGMLGLFHHGGDMEQRLRRNATDVEADTAEGRVAFDDDSLHAEVRGPERGGIAAGTGAEHQHFAVEIHLAGVVAGSSAGCRSWGRCSGCRRRGRGCGRGCGSDRAHLHQCHQRAFGDLVADLDLQFRHHAGHRGRHIHGRLVGLQGDQRILGLDHVADLDQDFDDRHILEVANVGDFHFDDVTHLAFLPV